MKRVFVAVPAIFAIVSALAAGCGDSGPGGGGGPSTIHVDVPTSLFLDDIEVEAGVPSRFTFTFDLPVVAGPLTDLDVDMEATLAATSITIDAASRSGAAGEDSQTATMRGWIVAKDDAEIACENGTGYGPFFIQVGNTTTLESISPSSVTARPSTMAVINTGSFAVCVEIESPVDATVSVDQVPIDVVECAAEPANIAGRWIGTYSCDNTNCDDEGGDVDLTIVQDGHTATYTDTSGASYSGTVCGNEFRFDGGVFGVYAESGVFTLGSGGSASKTSSFQSVFSTCRGDCTDDLHRP